MSCIYLLDLTQPTFRLYARKRQPFYGRIPAKSGVSRSLVQRGGRRLIYHLGQNRFEQNPPVSCHRSLPPKLLILISGNVVETFVVVSG